MRIPLAPQELLAAATVPHPSPNGAASVAAGAIPVPVTPADLARTADTLGTWWALLEVTAPKNFPTPDVRTLLTMDQARALPGMLGRIAPPVLKQHGYYSYTEMPSGRKILLELEQNPGIRGGAHE